MLEYMSASAALVFDGLSYSPALLLDGCFDASILNHPDYQKACCPGFYSYFNCDGFLEFDTREQLFSFIEDELYIGIYTLGFSLPWCVGKMCGWLSALSLTDRSLALVGLEMFVMLVAYAQRGVTC